MSSESDLEIPNSDVEGDTHSEKPGLAGSTQNVSSTALSIPSGLINVEQKAFHTRHFPMKNVDAGRPADSEVEQTWKTNGIAAKSARPPVRSCTIFRP